MLVVTVTVQMEPGTWLRIALVLLGAFALSRLLPRLVRRAVRRMLDTRVRQRFAALRAHAPRTLVDSGPTPSVRYAQRAEALGTLAKHLTSFTIWVTAAMLILHDLDVALVTLVTGAGFLGVAIALGAQDLLRDYTAGFFMLLDDRFGLGDRVEVGEIVGDRRDEPALDVHPRRGRHGVVCAEWSTPRGRSVLLPGVRHVGAAPAGRRCQQGTARRHGSRTGAGVRATDAQPRCRSMRRGHDHARKSG